jgi:twinkle protein
VTGRLHIPAGEIFDDGLRLYRQGGTRRGDMTGWVCVDELYTVAPGQWTVVTGIPQSGKSEWLDALLVNLAERDDRWFFALYSPENWPPSEHLIKLVEKRVRKPFHDGPRTRMTEEEYRDGAQWVLQRFVWLDTPVKTPIALIEGALQVQSMRGDKYGVVLDPWNTLDHERGGMTETDYISRVLTDVTHLVRDHQAHAWLVAHPQKLLKDNTGKRPVPTPYDISGSAHWYNKADNIITVHRAQGDETQDVEIHVQKVRFKRIGRIGKAVLKYDKVIGRYFEWPHPTPVDYNGRPEFYCDPEARY